MIPTHEETESEDRAAIRRLITSNMNELQSLVGASIQLLSEEEEDEFVSDDFQPDIISSIPSDKLKLIAFGHQFDSLDSTEYLEKFIRYGREVAMDTIVLIAPQFAPVHLALSAMTNSQQDYPRVLCAKMTLIPPQSMRLDAVYIH
jgi:hypothetical protein